jgi:pimeloyl-ACP methyl ester carboxylesterase
MGSGSPTVILEAGLGGYAFDWRSVQPDVAKFTRVCAYDRAGSGKSPPGPVPRDTRAQVSDLEKLLKAAAVRPLYVLVGHSMGGYNVQLFASRHIEDVVGIVFVDSSTPNQLPCLYASLPAIEESDKRSLVRVKACADPARDAETAENCTRAAPEDFPPELAKAFATTQGLSVNQAFASEVESFMERDSAQVLAENRDLGSMPLIVLTRTELSTNMSKADAELEWKLWNQTHEKLAALSKTGVNRPVPGAGHYIHLDKPEAVIEAIRGVVTEARKRR